MKNNKNIFILVGCVVLLVIGVGYYFSASQGESTVPGGETPVVVTDEATNPQEHAVMKPPIPPDESTEQITPEP